MVSESTKLSSVLVTIIIIISAGILALEFQPVATGDWDLEDYELQTFL